MWLSNFSNTIYWRDYLLPITYSWFLCHKLIDHICGFICRLSVLFLWPMCLFLCWYHMFVCIFHLLHTFSLVPSLCQETFLFKYAWQSYPHQMGGPVPCLGVCKSLSRSKKMGEVGQGEYSFHSYGYPWLWISAPINLKNSFPCSLSSALKRPSVQNSTLFKALFFLFLLRSLFTLFWLLHFRVPFILNSAGNWIFSLYSLIPGLWAALQISGCSLTLSLRQYTQRLSLE